MDEKVLEKRIKAKIPGVDTGICIKQSFCDICSPMPNCGVNCYIKDGKVIKVEGIDGHPAGNGVLCTKGLALRQYVYSDRRIKTPLKRVGEKGEGKFEPISWDEAYEIITSRLKEIKANTGASSVAFYAGYNKWYRPYLQRLCYSFGSVNYGSESSTCFNATGMAWMAATGHDMNMPDRRNAGCFLGWGYNPYHSRNMGRAPKGGRKGNIPVIIVDPRKTPAVRDEADLHLQLIPGTDGALAHAIARELIVNDKIDHKYIEENVYGFEEYKELVMEFTPEKAEKITGVKSSLIKEAARIIGDNRPLAINQSASAYIHHKNGFQNFRAISALSAIMGSYDRPGGLIPTPDTIGHTRVGFGSNIHEFEFEKYPKDQPLPVGAVKYPLWTKMMGEMQACDLSRQILTKDPYPVNALIAHGMNYRMFGNDTELKEALMKIDFFVDMDLFMTDSAMMADIVLPAASSLEREELKVYPGAFGWYTTPVIEPYFEAKADDEVIFELARRLDVDDDILKQGRDACYKAIFDGTPVVVDMLKERKGEIVKLDPPAARRALGENSFDTPTGKFELHATVIDGMEGLDPLPIYYEGIDDADKHEFPLQLVAGGRLPFALHSRLHDIAWLRKFRKEPMADINDDDAKELGIEAGDDIRLSTSAGYIVVKANPTDMVKKGLVFMYHGYREADVNSLIPKDHNDPYTGYPGYRSVRCKVAKEAK